MHTFVLLLTLPPACPAACPRDRDEELDPRGCCAVLGESVLGGTAGGGPGSFTGDFRWMERCEGVGACIVLLLSGDGGYGLRSYLPLPHCLLTQHHLGSDLWRWVDDCQWYGNNFDLTMAKSRSRFIDPHHSRLAWTFR